MAALIPEAVEALVGGLDMGGLGGAGLDLGGIGDLLGSGLEAAEGFGDTLGEWFGTDAGKKRIQNRDNDEKYLQEKRTLDLEAEREGLASKRDHLEDAKQEAKLKRDILNKQLAAGIYTTPSQGGGGASYNPGPTVYPSYQQFSTPPSDYSRDTAVSNQQRATKNKAVSNFAKSAVNYIDQGSKFPVRTQSSEKTHQVYNTMKSQKPIHHSVKKEHGNNVMKSQKHSAVDDFKKDYKHHKTTRVGNSDAPSGM